MDHTKISLPIHSALIPVFYKNFRCLAQDCRDSCCVNWGITFDKKDYLRLRRLDAPPALRERLERGVRREKKGDRGYGKFDLAGNDGRCPFLDPDGLCAIQRACGHDALPHVCTTYPRHIIYSPAAKEHSMSPSCEGVLRQLWQLPDGIEFIEDPLPKAEQRNINILQGENLLLYFVPIRSLFIDVLQNRAQKLFSIWSSASKGDRVEEQKGAGADEEKLPKRHQSGTIRGNTGGTGRSKKENTSQKLRLV